MQSLELDGTHSVNGWARIHLPGIKIFYFGIFKIKDDSSYYLVSSLFISINSIPISIWWLN
jgi:hypothetical protein